MAKEMLTWPLTSDGMYYVKSAYNMLALEAQISQPGPSTLVESKWLWNGTWKLSVPNKIWHFMWRASGESLPTKFNFHVRHVLNDNLCNLCDEHLEDAIHYLRLCDHVKQIWLLDSMFSFLRTKNSRRFNELVTYALSTASLGTTTLFPMVAWCIWNKRNKIREKQQC